MNAPKRTIRKPAILAQESAAAGSGKAFDRHSPILCEISRLNDEWWRLPPELFKRLVAKIAELRNRKIRPTVAAKLLNRLAQIEKDGTQWMLVGQLMVALGESPTHKILSREKEERTELLRKAVKSLRCAADSLGRLAALDNGNATSAMLVYGAAASNPYETMGKWKTNLAVEVREHASALEKEVAALRGSYLRRLGVQRGIYGNPEWLSLLRETFDFSFGELALLFEAASQEWMRKEIDVDPKTLKDKINRFLKLNLPRD